LPGIVGREHFNLYHIAVVPLGQQFFTTQVTGKVQHENLTLPESIRCPWGSVATGTRSTANQPMRRTLAARKRLYLSVAGFPIRVKLNLGSVPTLPGLL